jgi:hypothetical protein
MLDRTLGSFFMARVGAGMLAIVSQFGLLCTDNAEVQKLSSAFYLTSLFVLMMATSTVLSHRYLLAKAEVMCNMSGGLSGKSSKSHKASSRTKNRAVPVVGMSSPTPSRSSPPPPTPTMSSPSPKGSRRVLPGVSPGIAASSIREQVGDLKQETRSIEGLKAAFKYEVRAIVCAPIPVIIAHLAGAQQAVSVVGAIGIVIYIVLDVTFSVLVTMLFLEPILDTMQMARTGTTKSRTSYKRLQTSKYMTLSGTVLALVSSILLYANVIWYFLAPERVGSKHATNPFVSGFYFCSALNTLGVLLVCGWAKKYMDKSSPQIEAANDRRKTKFQFDSKAYDTVPVTVAALPPCEEAIDPLRIRKLPRRE